MGFSSQGKSTLAAALCARGRRLIADDVVAVQTDHLRPTIMAGFPQLKLCPCAVGVLGDDVSALAPLHPAALKLAYPAAGRFKMQAVTLKRLYVLSPDLADGQPHHLETLTSQQTFADLLRYSYCATFLQDHGLATHFAQCGALANQIGASCLHRSHALDQLASLAASVEEDVYAAL